MVVVISCFSCVGDSAVYGSDLLMYIGSMGVSRFDIQQIWNTNIAANRQRVDQIEYSREWVDRRRSAELEYAVSNQKRNK